MELVYSIFLDEDISSEVDVNNSIFEEEDVNDQQMVAAGWYRRWYYYNRIGRGGSLNCDCCKGCCSTCDESTKECCSGPCCPCVMISQAIFGYEACNVENDKYCCPMFWANVVSLFIWLIGIFVTVFSPFLILHFNLWGKFKEKSSECIKNCCKKETPPPRPDERNNIEMIL